MNEKQMRVECAHGYGNAQGPRRTRGAVGAAHGATQGCESSLLSTLEPIAGGEPLRRVRGRAVPRFYAKKRGRPSLVPGVYFRLLLIGYFEGIDSERGMAWRANDSLALRRFLRVGLDESPPDHSTISRTRRLIDVETHREVFTWVLGVLAEKGLLKGKTLGIDATTLEANAALRTIVRRDTGEGYQEFLKRLAQESGIATPTREQLARLDRKRARKGSNEEWEHPHDPDARIAKMKDGRTHLAHKVEQAVDFSSGAVVAVTLQPADRGDTRWAARASRARLPPRRLRQQRRRCRRPGRHLPRRQWQRPAPRSSRFPRRHALVRCRPSSRAVASEWALAGRRPGPVRSALCRARTLP